MFKIPNSSAHEFDIAYSRAVRYCAITFSYTAISILLNYSEFQCSPFSARVCTIDIFLVTPPSAVGYANGIAQSIVSLARCFGPVLGGLVSDYNHALNLIRSPCIMAYCSTSYGVLAFKTMYRGIPLDSSSARGHVRWPLLLVT